MSAVVAEYESSLSSDEADFEEAPSSAAAVIDARQLVDASRRKRLYGSRGGGMLGCFFFVLGRRTLAVL